MSSKSNTKHLKLSENDEFSDRNLTDEDASQTFLAREIVQEVMKFGVSQTSLLKIIELLSLELENRAKMLAIVGVVRGNMVSNNSPIISE